MIAITVRICIKYTLSIYLIAISALDGAGTEPEKMKIVIIVVGTFAVVLAVALIVFFVVRNRRRYALIQ